MDESIYVYYLMYEAKPFPENSESAECGGAYISCWVNMLDQNLALNRAKSYVHKEGWEIVNIKESFITNIERYDVDSESYKCFNEAIEYGISSIFHTWSIEDAH